MTICQICGERFTIVDPNEVPRGLSAMVCCDCRTADEDALLMRNMTAPWRASVLPADFPYK